MLTKNVTFDKKPSIETASVWTASKTSIFDQLGCSSISAGLEAGLQPAAAVLQPGSSQAPDASSQPATESQYKKGQLKAPPVYADEMRHIRW